MKIDLNTELSTSSVTKKQTANAVAFFGKTGSKIVDTLDALHSQDALVTDNSTGVILAWLKSTDEETATKMASTAAGKRIVAACKALDKAKSLASLLNALKTVKPNRAMRVAAGTSAPKEPTAKPPKQPKTPKQPTPVEPRTTPVAGPDTQSQITLTSRVRVANGALDTNDTFTNNVASQLAHYGLSYTIKKAGSKTVKSTIQFYGRTPELTNFALVAFVPPENKELAGLVAKAIKPYKAPKTTTPKQAAKVTVRIPSRKPRVNMASYSALTKYINKSNEDGYGPEVVRALEKLAGVRSDGTEKRGTGQVITLEQDEAVYYRKSIKFAPVYFAETKYLGSMNLKGAGRFTVALQLPKRGEQLNDVTANRIVQLGTFKTFKEALGVFLGAVANPKTPKEIRDMSK